MEPIEKPLLDEMFTHGMGADGSSVDMHIPPELLEKMQNGEQPDDPHDGADDEHGVEWGEPVNGGDLLSLLRLGWVADEDWQDSKGAGRQRWRGTGADKGKSARYQKAMPGSRKGKAQEQVRQKQKVQSASHDELDTMLREHAPESVLRDVHHASVKRAYTVLKKHHGENILGRIREKAAEYLVQIKKGTDKQKAAAGTKLAGLREMLKMHLEKKDENYEPGLTSHHDIAAEIKSINEQAKERGEAYRAGNFSDNPYLNDDEFQHVQRLKNQWKHAEQKANGPIQKRRELAEVINEAGIKASPKESLKELQRKHREANGPRGNVRRSADELERLWSSPQIGDIGRKEMRKLVGRAMSPLSDSEAQHLHRAITGEYAEDREQIEKTILERLDDRSTNQLLELADDNEPMLPNEKALRGRIKRFGLLNAMLGMSARNLSTMPRFKRARAHRAMYRLGWVPDADWSDPKGGKRKKWRGVGSDKGKGARYQHSKPGSRASKQKGKAGALKHFQGDEESKLERLEKSAKLTDAEHGSVKRAWAMLQKHHQGDALKDRLREKAADYLVDLQRGTPQQKRQARKRLAGVRMMLGWMGEAKGPEIPKGKYTQPGELEQKEPWQLTRQDFERQRPFTYGDWFISPDGKFGSMHGSGGMGSNRVKLYNSRNEMIGYYDRSELKPYRKNRTNEQDETEKAAKKWLNYVHSETKKLKDKHSELLFKKQLMDTINNDPSDNDKLAEAMRSKGSLPTEAEYDEAEKIQNEIDKIKATPVSHFHPGNKEHQKSVADALEAGKDVPAEVLKDYPELIEKHGEKILFTGTDSLGREWRDGKLVAKVEDPKAEGNQSNQDLRGKFGVTFSTDPAPSLNYTRPMPQQLKASTVAKNESGEPVTVYHGSLRKFDGELHASEFEEMIFASENPDILSGYVGENGELIKLEIYSEKVLDLYQPIPSDILERISEVYSEHPELKSNVREISKLISEGGTAQERFSAIGDGVPADLFRATMMELGYDAIKHEDYDMPVKHSDEQTRYATNWSVLHPSQLFKSESQEDQKSTGTDSLGRVWRDGELVANGT